MTSPLRRNRRITAWSTAIGISLFAGAAAGQSPGPAQTTWQPFVPPATKPALPTIPVPTPAAAPLPELPSIPVPVTMPQTPAPQPVTVQPPRAARNPEPPVTPMPAIAVPKAPEMRPIPAPPTFVPAARPLAITMTAGQDARPAAPQAPASAVAPAARTPVSAFPAVLTKPQQPVDAAPGQPMPPPLSMDPPKGASPRDFGPTNLFRFEGDAALDSRILKEINKPQDRFPTIPVLVPPGTTYEPKSVKYTPMVVFREPNYVIHRRLFFEEQNAERAGWDAGPSQMLFSSLYFYRDVLLFPAKFASGCRKPYDSSAGKCMPGDPTPYYCYPPSDITVFGGFVGAAAITGVALILP